MCAEPRKNPGNEVDAPLCNFHQKIYILEQTLIGPGIVKYI